MAAAAGLDGGLLIGADDVVVACSAAGRPRSRRTGRAASGLDREAGSRAEIQERCCQGLSASPASHRRIVDAEAAIWQRPASSQASSGQLHRDSGTPVSAGSAHASAMASARSAAVNTGGRPLRGASFIPASRAAANRRRHLRTVSGGYPASRRSRRWPCQRPLRARSGPAAGRGTGCAPTGHGPLTRTFSADKTSGTGWHRHLILCRTRASRRGRTRRDRQDRRERWRSWPSTRTREDVSRTAPAGQGPRTLTSDRPPARTPPRAFSYIDAALTDATTLKLCRLRYVGSAHQWQFAIYRASHDDYDESVFPTGLPIGTCQDALDTACGLYLNDPTA